jgi:hypothetical protein
MPPVLIFDAQLNSNESGGLPPMNFIEQLFHIAPDGGNGMTELSFFIAIVSAIALVLWRHIRRVRMR